MVIFSVADRKISVKSAIENVLRSRNHTVKYLAKRKPNHTNFLPIFVNPDDTVYLVQCVIALFTGRSSSNYCYDCDRTYENAAMHSVQCPLCVAQCKACLRIGGQFPCEKTAPKKCEKCRREFFNDDCFAYHLNAECRWHTLNLANDLNLCANVFTCKCGVKRNLFYERTIRKDKRKPHNCQVYNYFIIILKFLVKNEIIKRFPFASNITVSRPIMVRSKVNILNLKD